MKKHQDIDFCPVCESDQVKKITENAGKAPQFIDGDVARWRFQSPTYT